MRISDWSSDVCSSDLAYTNGNYYVDFAFFCDLNNCNVPGGIGRVAMSGSFGAYQWSFDPVIPKVDTKKLTLNLRLSWARKGSEERSVGTECVSTCSSRGSPNQTKKKRQKSMRK